MALRPSRRSAPLRALSLRSAPRGLSARLVPILVLLRLSYAVTAAVPTDDNASSIRIKALPSLLRIAKPLANSLANPVDPATTTAAAATEGSDAAAAASPAAPTNKHPQAKTTHSSFGLPRRSGFRATSAAASATPAAAAANDAAGAAASKMAAVQPQWRKGPIRYLGGPVVASATLDVYLIYYGSWPAGSGQEVFENFVRSLSSTTEQGGRRGGGGGVATVKQCLCGVLSAPTHPPTITAPPCPFPSRPFPSRPFPSRPFPSRPFPSRPFPSRPFPSRPFPSRPFPSRPFPSRSHPPCSPPLPAPFPPICPPHSPPYLFLSPAVKHVLTAGDLPFDSSAIYMLMGSKDVRVSGFCTDYCGWHSLASHNGANLVYGFLGHHGACPNGCMTQKGTSPNNNPGIDATVSTLAHEIAEAATDPDLRTGWLAPSGDENADLCSWQYGNSNPLTGKAVVKFATGTSGNQYRYNLVGAGGMRFLVQQNWDRTKQKCVIRIGGGEGGGGMCRVLSGGVKDQLCRTIGTCC
ncbi:unnamed protein product [Closterium sp. NIES-65]|nr:unnamed protein product [Closterium sp. NIES-65]